MDMLVKLYNHIIDHYMYEHYKKESQNPGNVQAVDITSSKYCACVWVCIFVFHVLITFDVNFT